MWFNDTQFITNYASTGSIVSLSFPTISNKQGNVLFGNVIMKNNHCHQGCIVYSESGVPIVGIEDSLVLNNTADTDSAFAYIANKNCLDSSVTSASCDGVGELHISNVNFTNNSALNNKVGLIYLGHYSIKMHITLSNFTDNYILNKHGTKGSGAKAGHFYTEEANEVLIENCIFSSYSTSVMNILTKAEPRVLFSINQEGGRFLQSNINATNRNMAAAPMHFHRML